MSNVTVRRQDAPAETRSRGFRRFYTMVLLYVFCTLLYYFGEVIDFFGWEALRWDFFYSVHDIHRLLFLAPIIYAGYFFGVKAAVIIMIIAINTFLPRALFVSPFPDPLLRTILFIIITGVIGYIVSREAAWRRRLEAIVRAERKQTLGILERMEKGALIIGPDHRIRFVNPSLAGNLGEATGLYCYQYLRKLDEPCQRVCKLPDILGGRTETWECNLPDGETYEVLASPYVDSDGTVCLLAVLRKQQKARR